MFCAIHSQQAAEGYGRKTVVAGEAERAVFLAFCYRLVFGLSGREPTFVIRRDVASLSRSRGEDPHLALCFVVLIFAVSW